MVPVRIKWVRSVRSLLSITSARVPGVATCKVFVTWPLSKNDAPINHTIIRVNFFMRTSFYVEYEISIKDEHIEVNGLSVLNIEKISAHDTGATISPIILPVR
jgi:hypothetical protein